jgi:hypothetical protein
VERREKKSRKKEAIAKANGADAGSDSEFSEDDDLEDDYRSLKKERKMLKKVKSGQLNASDLEDSDVDSE